VFTVFQLDSAVSKVISKNPKIFLITELDKILSDESISNQEKVVTIKSAFKKLRKLKHLCLSLLIKKYTISLARRWSYGKNNPFRNWDSELKAKRVFRV
jgi:hypothetical protein